MGSNEGRGSNKGKGLDRGGGLDEGKGLDKKNWTKVEGQMGARMGGVILFSEFIHL